MKTPLRRSICSLYVCAFLVAGAAPILASKLGIFASHEDIGGVSKKGKVKYTSKRDTYAITGSGANIWGKADAFQFVYEQVTGDVSLGSNLAWEGQGTEGHRKAGIMIRQTLAPDSPYVDVMVHGDGLTSLQYREAKGDVTKEMRSELKAAHYIRIERRGDNFSIAVGPDADDVKTTGPVTLHMQDPVYIGFAVCSHNDKVSETAIFKSPKIATGPAKMSMNFPSIARF